MQDLYFCGPSRLRGLRSPWTWRLETPVERNLLMPAGPWDVTFSLDGLHWFSPKRFSRGALLHTRRCEISTISEYHTCVNGTSGRTSTRIQSESELKSHWARGALVIHRDGEPQKDAP